MDNAFMYIEEYGIDTEESYPYTGVQSIFCSYSGATIGATCSGYVDIEQYSESQLHSAVATVGPISTAIDADHRNFQLYHSGVYDEPDCSSTELDHGVLVVGYGTLNGKDYWLVKNSWGPHWGMEGYIMMSRNKDNQCGIATLASYPLV
ncbi:cathepsin L1-like [Paramuricea clavata]|uniref:Cathepsin L1-like n=1 Tax=Paramuricea clavata TaxID=317549 RepID=A0A7D9ENM1_PARCT|nr:cathepsin L1-like [Paramuricea clavata]